MIAITNRIAWCAMCPAHKPAERGELVAELVIHCGFTRTQAIAFARRAIP
jgi:hypothetical protein